MVVGSAWGSFWKVYGAMERDQFGVSWSTTIWFGVATLVVGDLSNKMFT
jgi:hypothetical protein